MSSKLWGVCKHPTFSWSWTEERIQLKQCATVLSCSTPDTTVPDDCKEWDLPTIMEGRKSDTYPQKRAFYFTLQLQAISVLPTFGCFIIRTEKRSSSYRTNLCQELWNNRFGVTRSTFDEINWCVINSELINFLQDQPFWNQLFKINNYKYKFKIQFDALQPLESHLMIILHC